MKCISSKFNLWLVLPICLLAISCGSGKRQMQRSYGGSWSQAQLHPGFVKLGESNGPGDSMTIAQPTSVVVKTNLKQIKTDLRHMTSKEKIEGIRSEIPIFNRNQSMFQDSASAAVYPQKNYLGNINILVGGGLSLIGLIALVVFPVFGFIILIIGLMMGIIGLYDVNHPEDQGDYSD